MFTFLIKTVPKIWNSQKHALYLYQQQTITQTKQHIMATAITTMGYMFENKKIKTSSWMAFVNSKFVSILEEIQELRQNTVTLLNTNDECRFTREELTFWIEDLEDKFNVAVKKYAKMITVTKL